MRIARTRITLLASCILAMTGCGESAIPDLNLESPLTTANGTPRNSILETNHEILDLRPAANPDRNAYFGDLHVHTGYSFDAYAFGTIATPYDAYRYAKGEALLHPAGYEIQMQQPLDFYAVTDHGMFMGVVQASADTSTDFSRYAVAKPLHNINASDNYDEGSIPQRSKAFATFLPSLLTGIMAGEVDPKIAEAVTKSAWRDSIEAADQHYIPGRFTTFAAYEYTSSTDDRGNLHRNVVFRGTDRLPAVPFSRFHSQNPEGLWDWMDGLREQGIESLAIPHNSNGSNGQMFTLTDWAGNPMGEDYVTQRMRNEPIVEITQVKGTSDTHPALSKNDEWADFEIMPFRVATTLPSAPPGSYVRDAYLRGLALQEQSGLNPYKFGLVGASDTHVAASSDREETFFSKAGLLDGTAERRGSIPASFMTGTVLKWLDPNQMTEVDGHDYIASSSFETWSASGLAGVWAEENTREAIYDAFRRKETFATTGPRIKVRFFAGYDIQSDWLDQTDMARKAYDSSVAMGSDLSPRENQAPKFLVWAVRDPLAAPLQRIQIIKGYVKNGEHHEMVYDAACSDGLSVDPATNRCPDNGASVNLSDCSISGDVGAAELKNVWTDPDFDPTQEAFYYVRVLENPTCRWSTWDALRAGVEPRSDLAKTIQERAWSSPIWYRGKES
ncbi:DUF3604 domain-containing protein [Aequoribacter fuscus]|uniref:DUF3604 domain-containing protein n=1 Tax=Aequoribacter fuscus TaxID=2518989 RepID=UPI0013642BD3|nr:DUF3604 domain-containing protein [Aequoribacter fuscus]QHJ87502.1 DUF3604 domain-containing protein [Aequoribacter fuscus]